MAEVRWDDELWDRVWERVLTPVERHDVAMSVVRRRLAHDPFERRLGIELARRWRRRAVGLAVLYAIWTVFWGAIGWAALRDASPQTAAVPLGCVVAGALAAGLCLAFRRWVAPVARAPQPVVVARVSA